MDILKSNFPKLEAEKLIKFTPSAEETKIGKSVVDRIGRILFLTSLKDRSVFAPFPWVSFYESINWQWMTKEGTLPKRIAKWYYVQFKTKLSLQIVSLIGNITRAAGDISNHFYFDITKKFEWKAGDFSDGVSCFFASRSEIRCAMEAHPNFYAIRFYNSIPAADAKFTVQRVWHLDNDLAYVGRGRAFVYIGNYESKEKELLPFLLVFNGYGYTTNMAAGRLAYFLNLPLKRIIITNNENQHGGLYLNDGGFIIGDNRVLNEVNTFDFGVKTAFEKGHQKEFNLAAQREALLKKIKREQERNLFYYKRFGGEVDEDPPNHWNNARIIQAIN